MGKVVGEVGADAKRRLAHLRGIVLYLDGLIGGEGIGEDDLLGTAVDVERLVFVANLAQFLTVVTAVHAQSLEQIGEVL